MVIFAHHVETSRCSTVRDASPLFLELHNGATLDSNLTLTQSSPALYRWHGLLAIQFCLSLYPRPPVAPYEQDADGTVPASHSDQRRPQSLSFCEAEHVFRYAGRVVRADTE